MEGDVPSFYELGGYRENIRRYKEGIDQLVDIQAMVKERVEIESNYSRALQLFHEKWTTHVTKLSASVIQIAWKDVLEESFELQKLHTNVKDRLCNEILKTIGLYLKENHHSSAFRASREAREIEDQFDKAQRIWRRQYEKVERARKAFHLASKLERSAQIQLKNASGDSSASADLVSKCRERHQKCQDEVMKSEAAYRTALSELDHLKKSYIAHMNDVFETCQQKELKRLKFVFEMLAGLQKVVVDLATATKMKQLHTKLEKILVADDQRFSNELLEWSRKFGPESEVTWPEYEPYTPSLHMIGSKKNKKKNGEVILVKQVVKSDDSLDGSACTTLSSAGSKETCRTPPSVNKITEFESDELSQRLSNGEKPSSNQRTQLEGRIKLRRSNQLLTAVSCHRSSVSTSFDAAIYGDNFDEVPVSADFYPYAAKVIHDYDAQDSDELSLVRGDEILVLGGPDQLNWSLGRKNGRTGLFPSAYAQKL